MIKFNIKYLFCNSFRFERGIWVGEFPFSVLIQEQEYLGHVYASYRQSTPTPSLSKRVTFHQSVAALDEDTKEALKNVLYDQFDTIFDELLSLFVIPRELHTPKPVITSFRLHPEHSDDSFWFITFSATHTAPTSGGSYVQKFELTMERVQNVWHYQLKVKQGSALSYKNTMKWEDNLMKEVVNEIFKIPEVRLKFHYQKVHFKYQKK